MKYTKFPVDDYIPDRHLEISKSYDLVKSQALDIERLNSAVKTGEIKIYEHKENQYLDRFDIGRVYHNDIPEKKGITIERYFTEGVDNIKDSVGSWAPRVVEIKEKKEDGTQRVVFRMDDATFPVSWDDNDARIVANKYFFKPKKEDWKQKMVDKIGVDHENSLYHLATRVSNFFAEEGNKLGYFATEEDKTNFRDELLWLQLNRKFAFNSPVQFNSGIHNEYGIEGNKSGNFFKNPETGEIETTPFGEYVHPQCHACFIAGPQDDLEKIASHMGDETRVFSAGSGIGQNIGVLRGEGEPLSGGGKSSGSMSFLKTYDSNAGSVKSGGKSRRAARMTQMRYTHPDIFSFVEDKVEEDHKALILMEAGYSSGMDGEAYSTVGYQNTNLSVRLDDFFFEQLNKGGEIELYNIVDGSIAGKVSADYLMKKIAYGSWRIGDPGAVYESKVDQMHTCPNSGRQNASNPCSEYMFLDDTSCNLASMNILAFSDSNGNLNVKNYSHAARLIEIALDIANNAASYPIKRIAEISPEYRTTGLGYGNLGSFIMRNGFAYDSDEGRALAGAITALTTGIAYETSAELSEHLGSFVHFEFNKRPMMEVMKKHQDSLEKILWNHVPENLKTKVIESWKNVLERGEKVGFRNAQATVLAPTGTISYLMGSSDATGIEPSISLVIEKNLAGGGKLILTNREIENALKNLGYSEGQVKDVRTFLEKRKTIFGAPHLNPDHYKVFDTAFGDASGQGSIAIEGHIKMMAAAQPFISGGISKTINMPNSATVKDIYDGFVLGYKLGLKGLTPFRDGSKPSSALGFGDKSFVKLKRGEKEDLPSTGSSFRHEFRIGGVPFLLNIGEYSDGRPGEVVMNCYSDSMLGNLLKSVGIDASTALKDGVKLERLASKWIGSQFEPNGFVTIDNPKGSHPYIKSCLSIKDFLGRFLLLNYLGKTEFATEPEKVDMKNLRGFKNGAFKTYKRMSIDDWNFEQVINDPELGGFVKDDSLVPTNGNGKNGNHSDGKVSNTRGVTCKDCGNLMTQTGPNCFSCNSCGDKVGGCGL